MKKEIFLGLCVLLSGCTLFPAQREAPPVYILKGGTLEASSRLKTPLVVYLPTSEASLDTPRIAMTLPPYHRDYIENGEWSDHLPKIVHETLLDTLSQRWGGEFVHRAEASLETDYGLLGEIQDFSVYLLAEGKAEVRLKMSFRLVDFPERRVIAAQKFSEVVPLCAFRMNGIVGAFNQGMQTIVRKVAFWIEGVSLKRRP